ncbi:MAG: hypothetical protein AABX65_04600, partial [Nanoarchaeota archaeon]
MENVAGVFNVKIESKVDKETSLYLVINSKNVKFDSDYKQREKDETTINLDSIKSREIKFAIGGIKAENLEFYASPVFSLLEFEPTASCDNNGKCGEGENRENCRNDCKPWGIAIILILGVVALGFAAYLFLQWWYKVRYEKHLFVNRNDVYNILNFISNAKSQGMQENEIKAKLRQTGWNSEQISYVQKKMQGKAIMPFDF